MAQAEDKKPWHRRRPGVIIVGVCVLLLLFLVFSQNAFNLTPILSPDSSQQTLVFVALSTLILLLTLALCFVRQMLRAVRLVRGIARQPPVCLAVQVAHTATHSLPVYHSYSLTARKRDAHIDTREGDEEAEGEEAVTVW